MSSSQKNETKLFDRALKVVAYASGFVAVLLAIVQGTVPAPNEESSTSKVVAIGELPDQTHQETRAHLLAIRQGLPISTPVSEGPRSIYGFDRIEILADSERRIGEDFLIPPGLFDRVGFWFDIYSRYDYHKRVIHHVLYPWVIYKVVDVEPIISASYPRFRWMRNEVADAHVKKEMQKVRAALDSLARKKRTTDLRDEKLNDDERMVRDALSVLGSDVRRLAKRARGEVRVQTGQRNFFADGLQTAPRYLGAMEEIFAKAKLPIELTRLPLVESSFNKHAKSKVGAAGIWQFMESTGRKKKLIIDGVIDERKSPFKATAAAASLLKENHMILGRSWPLAVTAWNHGPGGIKKAARASGTRDLSRIIELYHSKRFDFASENFYAEFLAALYTERYADRIFPGLPKHAPLSVQELTLTRRMRVDDITRVASLSLDEFISINPDLEKLIKSHKVLRKGLRIQLPKETHGAVEYLMAGDENGSRLVGVN